MTTDRSRIPATSKAEGGSDAVELTNRLPKWSDEIGSLTMKFLGSRIAESSSKNFLFEMPIVGGEADGGLFWVPPSFFQCCRPSPQAASRLHTRDPTPEIHVVCVLVCAVLSLSLNPALKPVIQFGKLGTGVFSLDYRWPMSPIQAFGMFLSTNAWTVKKSG